MEDAIRPNEQAARDIYARGYQTWSTLYDTACRQAFSSETYLRQLYTAFPNHPIFPHGLEVDTSFVNVALANGVTTWLAAEDDHLPPFKTKALFYVAWDKPTKIILRAETRYSSTTLPEIFGPDSQHIPILIQAWAFILSARWAELIPGAQISYQSIPRSIEGLNKSPKVSVGDPITIKIGTVSKDAATWWTAILSVGSGWDATIRNKNGNILHSPWSTVLESERPILVSANIKTEGASSHTGPTSFSAACRYLEEYCSKYGIGDGIILAALAAVILIPTTKYDNRLIILPTLETIYDDSRKDNEPPKAPRFSIPDSVQLDRLLTLSCNARGVKSLLTSVFFEPDVSCNMCGLWLRGSFAFLSWIKDPHILLRTLINRDPDLGFLWFSAFITGAYHKSLCEGRAGWWNVDFAAAAWTGTLMSFIQTLVPRPEPGTQSISRADECRLLFLCHDINYTITPLFPFPPFGSSSLNDTNLEVREHSLCGKGHGLKYAYFTWFCTDGTEIRQEPLTPAIAIRPKREPISTHPQDVEIDYDDCDSEDETSAMVTRNMFTWLRGEDGFPVAERAIREHEWIDNLDSDDDAPIEGDVRSTAGGHLHGWLLKTSTQRSNSI
ncbi:uncharacterized protein FTOL_10759 [Fusarium torulosum]|uniref:Immunoglobulin variable region used by the itc63b heavy chain n=1 Tax=Fusarium torulosum TaxID=33205 RepID=A0AAE8MJ28_9HYPO|nr:uncharacterized protein FTOL_10759 [Fusarium torulosum]